MMMVILMMIMILTMSSIRGSLSVRIVSKHQATVFSGNEMMSKAEDPDRRKNGKNSPYCNSLPFFYCLNFEKGRLPYIHPVGRLVGQLVGRLVGIAFVEIDEKWTFTERRGGRRDGEEGGTGRNEGQGGRRDEVGEKMKKFEKK